MSSEVPSLRAREALDRYDELRHAVELAVGAYDKGEPADKVMAGLRTVLNSGPSPRWDTENVKARAHDWNEKYGRPPAAIEWNPAMVRARHSTPEQKAKGEEMLARWASEDWPSAFTVRRYFGNWTNFMTACGWEPRQGPEIPRTEHRDLERLPTWGGWRLTSGYRQRLGISQSRLAEVSGISSEYISFIERGKQTNPTIRILLALAHGLQVPAAYLLADQMPVSQGRGASGSQGSS